MQRRLPHRSRGAAARRTRVGLLALAVPVCLAALAAPAATQAAKGLEVRVITAAPITAGTWDRQNYAAYTAAAKRLGWHLEIAQAVDYRKVADVLDRWGSGHVDIVFSTNSGFQKFLLAAAKRYPDTSWVNLGALTTTDDLPNVAGYTYDTCEFGFLQGVAAALVSKTHEIGAVGSVPSLPAANLVAGVRYGARLAVPGTNVAVRYSGDFVSRQNAEKVAAALLAKRADVVLPVTQNFVSAAIAAHVQRAHRYFIGAYADESSAAPRAVVTSVVVDFQRGYEQVGRQRAGGKFKPGIFTEGIKDGFVKILPFRLGFAGAAAKVQALAARLTTGKLQIANCKP